MKVLGIITEYNPFHYGHKIHLEESLAKSNADATICIMSGQFLQRGTAALVDQWARTKMALKAGVDLVIQLPVSYSIRSAEYFAYGGIKLLDSTKIVDYLCFGSESGIIEPLKFLGELLAQEPQELSRLIQEQIATGISYPNARSKAVLKYLDIKDLELDFSQEELATILNSPNNILGLEYIKALNNLDSPITPLTIKRQGADYSSKNLEQISSATAIRKQIWENKKENRPLLGQKLKTKLPTTTNKILKEEFSKGKGPISITDFEIQLLTLLRRISASDLKNYSGVRGGLENRIKTAAQEASSWTELIDKIKTKRFTQTRIQRILTHLLLDLQKKDLKTFADADGPLYFRILGFNQQGKNLLHQIKNKGELPLISKVANHYKSNYRPQNRLQKMLSYDLRANNLYYLAAKNKRFRQGNIDYRQQPIIIC